MSRTLSLMFLELCLSLSHFDLALTASWGWAPDCLKVEINVSESPSNKDFNISFVCSFFLDLFFPFGFTTGGFEHVDFVFVFERLFFGPTTTVLLDGASSSSGTCEGLLAWFDLLTGNLPFPDVFATFVSIFCVTASCAEILSSSVSGSWTGTTVSRSVCAENPENEASTSSSEAKSFNICSSSSDW